MGLLASVYYSHIVVGIVFYVYCYTFLPRHRYGKIRRPLVLENVTAFMILSIWRCKPPRLLPENFGFFDVLHRASSDSVWTHNKFQLTIAAMPSLHFRTSTLLTICLVKFSPHWLVRIAAPIWPMVMGLTVIATANPFVLDTVAGSLLLPSRTV